MRKRQILFAVLITFAITSVIGVGWYFLKSVEPDTTPYNSNTTNNRPELTVSPEGQSAVSQARPPSLNQVSSGESENSYSFLPVYSVSIRVLQEKLAACSSKGACSKEELSLGGITKLLGLIIDKPGHDLILFGLAEADRPAIQTSDFAIALRNTWLKYAPLKNNTFQYSYPGCDIRPTPRTMQQLQVLHQQIFKTSAVDRINSILGQWQRTCESLQQVTVFGIPFDSHFSQVMVKADYDMKSIADGTDNVGIPGLVSLSDMRFNQIQNAVVAGHHEFAIGSGMNRFWLSPDKNDYEKDEGIVLLKQSPVRLLTQPTGVALGGQLVDIGGQDSMADEFAKHFSILYDKIAVQRPVYRELENLFQLIALAKIIHFQQADQEAGIDLKYFLNDFPIPETHVDSQVRGKPGLKEFKQQRELPNSIETVQLWLPSCGGVEVAIEPDESMFQVDRSGLLSGSRKQILDARPTPQSLSWSVPVASISSLAGLQHSRRLRTLNRSNQTIKVFTVFDEGSEYHVYDGGPDDVFNPGLDVEKLMQHIDKSLQAETDITGVYLQLEKFSQDKIAALEASTSIHYTKLRPRFSIHMLPNTAGTLDEEMMLSPGILFLERSKPVEQVKSGPFAGWYRGVVKLMVWAGGRLWEVTVTILAQSATVVDSFLEKLDMHFAVTAMLPLSATDLVNQIRYQLIKEQGLEEEKLKIIISGKEKGKPGEPGSIHFVHSEIIPMRSVSDGILYCQQN